jgi:carbonic anhydrase
MRMERDGERVRGSLTLDRRHEGAPGYAHSDLEGNVRESVKRIEESPFIPNKDSIRGFVYEVETGKLREVT